MRNRRNTRLALAVLALVTLPLAVRGFINPNFTPVHLVDQTDTILLAKIKSKEIGDRVDLEVTQALKGKAPASLVIDLGGAPKESAETARKQFAGSLDRLAILFAGDSNQAYLHVNGTWLRLSGREGAWRLEAADESLLGTWDGGTDMLARCVQYILAEHGTASVPSDARISWRAIRKIGSVGGRARDITAVDLSGDGNCCLFVAGDKGDRLLRPDGNGDFVDITATVKLASRSHLAAWGDFGGSGRMDLASYDGNALTIWAQAGDGTFLPVRPGGTFDLPEGLVGMTTTAVGTAKTPGLLLSPASGQPVLLKPAGRNAFEAVKLPAPATPLKDIGKVQACLVADFTGDSLIDVIQPFEKGGLIYLGNKDGFFDAPKACAVGCTVGGGKATLGDLDGDGLPDVLVAGAEGVKIFQNRGGGAFEETLGSSGEVSYKNQPQASWCGVCDLNHDSRQGIFITYGAGPMMLFFSRGFRSFGTVPRREMGLEEIPDFGKGQQMALFGDLTGGGVQDLFLVTAGGDIWCALRDLGFEEARPCVEARMGPGSPVPGPVNVSLWKEKRCLGTVVTRAGGGPAFFGMEDRGAYALKWQFPGGKEMSKSVTVKSKPVVVLLEDTK